MLSKILRPFHLATMLAGSLVTGYLSGSRDQRGLPRPLTLDEIRLRARARGPWGWWHQGALAFVVAEGESSGPGPATTGFTDAA